MNALTTTKTVSTAGNLPMLTISRPLAALLRNEPDGAKAVSDIARTPALLEEARRVLPDLRAHAAAPAGEEGVYRVIYPRRALFPQPKRTEAEADAWWGDYYDVLVDIPESALEAGMKAWIAKPDARFMPKPGELRALALKTANDAVRAHDRCKAAVEFDGARAAPETPYDFGAVYRQLRLPAPPQPIGSADRERIRAQARDFLANDDERQRREAARRPAMRSTAGQADERGLTPAMRAHLARKREGGAA